MYTGRTDFDVTTGRLQNQRYFWLIYCVYCYITNCVETMVCGVNIICKNDGRRCCNKLPENLRLNGHIRFESQTRNYFTCFDH